MIHMLWRPANVRHFLDVALVSQATCIMTSKQQLSACTYLLTQQVWRTTPQALPTAGEDGLNPALDRPKPLGMS